MAHAPYCSNTSPLYWIHSSDAHGRCSDIEEPWAALLEENALSFASHCTAFSHAETSRRHGVTLIFRIPIEIAGWDLWSQSTWHSPKWRTWLSTVRKTKLSFIWKRFLTSLSLTTHLGPWLGQLLVQMLKDVTIMQRGVVHQRLNPVLCSLLS